MNKKDKRLKRHKLMQIGKQKRQGWLKLHCKKLLKLERMQRESHSLRLI
jgi:hypothetical protein